MNTRQLNWVSVVFGLALLAYTAGLHWIYISLHDYGGLPSWMSALSTVVLAAYVSLYAAGAAWVIRLMRPRLDQARTPWLAAATVTLFEWLRGTLLTGFPWLGLGYLVIDTPLAGYAPLVGVYGLGFLAVLCVVWLIQIFTARSLTAIVLLIATLTAGVGLQAISFTEPHGRPLRVALVQGAIAQSIKFDPARELTSHATHIELASTAAVPGGAQLIVLPETAVVRPWQSITQDMREGYARLATRSGAVVMLGAPVQDPDGYRNSLIALSPEPAVASGQFFARYDKQHLVPFGEFIPWGFQWFVDMMNMPLGSFQRGTPDQLPIAVADQRIGVNICFEDLFAEEIIAPLAPSKPLDQQPTILLNVSNLAWFGDTIALSQHLAIARLRAMETGRPMLRATNTGVTAIINAKGEVVERLPNMRQGLLSGQVQGMHGTTPFARWGHLPVLLFSFALLILGIRTRRPAG